MKETELLQKAREFLRENREAIVADIGALVDIPSVQGSPAPGAPFGEGPRRALDRALEIAARMGFEPHSHEDCMGWFDLPGEREAHIATIAHLDVVPAGEGWTFEPFRMERRGDWLIGRGTDDDKGPLVYCMYLAKFFRESGIKLRYTLRTLMGCNEETGMGDVGPYLAAQPQPLFCLSSDALFPVCNGEKGLFQGEFVSPKLEGNVVDIQAGEASNMIPERAVCLVKFRGRLPLGREGIEAATEDGLLRITAHGVGAHSAMPERGKNAIGLLVDFLLTEGLTDEDERPFFELLHRLHLSPYGQGLGVDCKDDALGALTCVGGVIRMRDGVIRQNINIRYPAAVTGPGLAERLEAAAGAAGSAFSLIDYSEPFFIPEEDPVIRLLLDAHREVTGSAAPAYAWGGGTYARCFRRAASFGPGLAGEEIKPDFVGDCHGPDEGTSLSTLDESFLVYALAVLRMQGLEPEELGG